MISAVGTGGHVPPTFLEIAVVTFENNAAQKKFSLLCSPRYNFLPTVVMQGRIGYAGTHVHSYVYPQTWLN